MNLDGLNKQQIEAVKHIDGPMLVLAGAGSGKTAVLTERVIQKIKRGTPVTKLLVLTFTKMAAKEMKERITNKLKEENLTEALEYIDSANIMTFDAYALSIVKKYYYLLDISRDISVIEPSVMTLYKSNTLEAIFNNLYDQKDSKFLSLIKDFFLKNDRELFNYIILLN